MARQSLLVGLVIITLIVNVVLGIELYYALHKPSLPSAQSPLNISGLQIITSNTTTQTTTVTSTVTETSTISVTSSSTSSSSTMTSSATSTNTSPLMKIYNFSFKVKFKLHVNKEGEYIIGIKPNTSFISLYVLLYFDDGETVLLSLNQTAENVTLDHQEMEVVVFIYGSSYENLTPDQIFSDLGLYYTYVGPASTND